MKGAEAEYVVPFARMFKMPRTKRANKAVNEIRNFAYKHTRSKDVKIAPELNQKVWENSKNIPRRVEVMLRKEGEGVVAYLKDSKEIEEARKREAAAEAEKAKKKKDDASKKKEKAASKDAKGEKKEGGKPAKEEAEDKKKAEEKRTREKAVEKAAIKRKTSKNG